SAGTAEIAEHRAFRFVVGVGKAKHVRRYSMTNRFLMSVAAAALIAGTGFANAQGTGTSREPSAGSSTQQNAPSEQTKSPSGMKSSHSDEKAAQPGAKNQRAQDDMKAGAKGEKSAQDNNMKGEQSAQDNNMKG